MNDSNVTSSSSVSSPVSSPLSSEVSSTTQPAFYSIPGEHGLRLLHEEEESHPQAAHQSSYGQSHWSLIDEHRLQAALPEPGDATDAAPGAHVTRWPGFNDTIEWHGPVPPPSPNFSIERGSPFAIGSDIDPPPQGYQVPIIPTMPSVPEHPQAMHADDPLPFAPAEHFFERQPIQMEPPQQMPSAAAPPTMSDLEVFATTFRQRRNVLGYTQGEVAEVRYCARAIGSWI